LSTEVEETTGGMSLPWEEFFRGHRAVMLLIDPDDGAVVDANPAACAWYGWSHEELCSRRISDINILSEEEIRVRLELARVEDCEFFDFRHRIADGSVRDIIAYSTPIQVGGRKLLHSIIQDVTERVRARAELRQTEAMRDVSEHAAGIGSFRWPLDGSVAAWSKEVYELFDVRPGEFGYDLPSAVAACVLPQDQAPLMAMLREVAAREELVST
jgi:PAS domain S-box-containing protein